MCSHNTYGNLLKDVHCSTRFLKIDLLKTGAPMRIERQIISLLHYQWQRWDSAEVPEIDT